MAAELVLAGLLPDSLTSSGRPLGTCITRRSGTSAANSPPSIGPPGAHSAARTCSSSARALAASRLPVAYALSVARLSTCPTLRCRSSAVMCGKTSRYSSTCQRRCSSSTLAA